MCSAAKTLDGGTARHTSIWWVHAAFDNLQSLYAMNAMNV